MTEKLLGAQFSETMEESGYSWQPMNLAHQGTLRRGVSLLAKVR